MGTTAAARALVTRFRQHDAAFIVMGGDFAYENGEPSGVVRSACGCRHSGHDDVVVMVRGCDVVRSNVMVWVMMML